MAALADPNTTAIANLNALQEAARVRDVELSIHQAASGADASVPLNRSRAAAALLANGI